jgi:hypothetical protein
MDLSTVASFLILACADMHSKLPQALIGDQIVSGKVVFIGDDELKLDSGCSVGKVAQVSIMDQPQSSIVFERRTAALISCEGGDLAKQVDLLRNSIVSTKFHSFWSGKEIVTLLTDDAASDKVARLPANDLLRLLAGIKNWSKKMTDFRKRKVGSLHQSQLYHGATHFVYQSLMLRFLLPTVDDDRFREKEFSERVRLALIAATLEECESYRERCAAVDRPHRGRSSSHCPSSKFF